MLLGMDDWMVTLAYLANIGIVAICVVYGALNYNKGDDSAPVLGDDNDGRE